MWDCKTFENTQHSFVYPLVKKMKRQLTITSFLDKCSPHNTTLSNTSKKQKLYINLSSVNSSDETTNETPTPSPPLTALPSVNNNKEFVFPKPTSPARVQSTQSAQMVSTKRVATTLQQRNNVMYDSICLVFIVTKDTSDFLNHKQQFEQLSKKTKILCYQLNNWKTTTNLLQRKPWALYHLNVSMCCISGRFSESQTPLKRSLNSDLLKDVDFALASLCLHILKTLTSVSHIHFAIPDSLQFASCLISDATVENTSFSFPRDDYQILNSLTFVTSFCEMYQKDNIESIRKLFDQSVISQHFLVFYSKAKEIDERMLNPYSDEHSAVLFGKSCNQSSLSSTALPDCESNERLNSSPSSMTLVSSFSSLNCTKTRDVESSLPSSYSLPSTIRCKRIIVLFKNTCLPEVTSSFDLVYEIENQEDVFRLSNMPWEKDLNDLSFTFLLFTIHMPFILCKKNNSQSQFNIHFLNGSFIPITFFQNLEKQINEKYPCMFHIPMNALIATTTTTSTPSTHTTTVPASATHATPTKVPVTRPKSKESFITIQPFSNHKPLETIVFFEPNFCKKGQTFDLKQTKVDCKNCSTLKTWSNLYEYVDGCFLLYEWILLKNFPQKSDFFVIGKDVNPDDLLPAKDTLYLLLLSPTEPKNSLPLVINKVRLSFNSKDDSFEPVNDIFDAYHKQLTTIRNKDK